MSQREVQHPDDPRVDRRGVFHLERRGDAAAGFEPEDVDQADGVGRWRTLKRRRQAVEAAVAEPASSERAVTVVGRDPDRVTERSAQVTEPALNPDLCDTLPRVHASRSTVDGGARLVLEAVDRKEASLLGDEVAALLHRMLSGGCPPLPARPQAARPAAPPAQQPSGHHH